MDKNGEIDYQKYFTSKNEFRNIKNLKYQNSINTTEIYMTISQFAGLFIKNENT